MAATKATFVIPSSPLAATAPRKALGRSNVPCCSGSKLASFASHPDVLNHDCKVTGKQACRCGSHRQKALGISLQSLLLMRLFTCIAVCQQLTTGLRGLRSIKRLKRAGLHLIQLIGALCSRRKVNRQRQKKHWRSFSAFTGGRSMVL